ncbi:MAG TPA: hypothetical protein VJZ71_21265 [Phycisphaerae bacterium]|nr:hypothetical protein [Phycisphaerae bacterium]
MNADRTQQNGPTATSDPSACSAARRDPFSQQDNGRSSLFDKLPEELRRRLDLAILHRIPPTFKDVWMQFELSKFGVSYSALYRYARRLRDRLNMAEAVFLNDDDGADVDAAIQKLLSRRLLELLLHTGGASCAKEIAALTSAQRKGVRTTVDLRRLEHDGEYLRLKSEALELARRSLESRLAHATPLRLACSNDLADGASAAAPATAQPAAE